MLPLLPFVAGIVTGAAVTKLWRSKTAKHTPDQAPDSLHQSTLPSQPDVASSLTPVSQVERQPARTAVPRKRRAPKTTDEVRG